MNNIIQKMNSNLFGKGKEKILECFYINRSKELYFSEILRETKLTQNTTLKHLKNLQENNLVISTKKIGNTFYKINPKNPQIYSIFSYFDFKKLNKLPSERKRAIIEFLEKLENKPLIVLVFGSTAKGTFGKESDIDLLLIYNKKESENKELKKEIEATTGTNIQTFIIDFDYFKEQLLKQEDNMIIHAIKTGFIISGHYIFYKEALK
ncbi:nucleotidyltransferase domain-containing protein [Candidatus Woesearchaeota archaeon]|nr:nucleotidyltransferase domain-containing protein [Candidatus Woesearchaeota archaeon]